MLFKALMYIFSAMMFVVFVDSNENDNDYEEIVITFPDEEPEERGYFR